MHLTPAFLLDNPALVEPTAPWCRRLDRLEIAIVSACPPWSAGGGSLRADLERTLRQLSEQLPLGPIYYQRVSRAVKGLDKCGVLKGSGSGRQRRFRLTARGFAALILNLCVPSPGAALDRTEMELQRTLVARWNLLAERLAELPADLLPTPAESDFFDRLRGLELWGQQIITDELLRRAMDVSRLIAEERERTAELRKLAAKRLELAQAATDPLIEIDLGRLLGSAAVATAAPEALVALRDLVAGVLPRLDLETSVLRLDSHLDYLDRLDRLYAKRQKVVEIDLLRRLLGGAK